MKHIRWDMLALPLAGIALGLFLIFRQPHYSAIILILMIYFTMLICGGCGLKWMLPVLSVGVIGVVYMLTSQDNYVQTRLDGWTLFSSGRRVFLTRQAQQQISALESAVRSSVNNCASGA